MRCAANYVLCAVLILTVCKIMKKYNFVINFVLLELYLRADTLEDVFEDVAPHIIIAFSKYISFLFYNNVSICM